MNRQTIIEQLRAFFKPEELVCDHTSARYGEQAWRFLRTDYLHTLLVVRRDILRASMTCNHSSAHQRGLRCNLCPIVGEKTRAGKPYLSAHVTGAAGDFTVSGMSAEEARRRIAENAHLLPYPVRMEQGVSWLHIDTYDTGAGQKITYFQP